MRVTAVRSTDVPAGPLRLSDGAASHRGPAPDGAHGGPIPEGAAPLGTTGGELLVINGSDLLADGGAGTPLVLDLDERRAGVEGTLPAIF